MGETSEAEWRLHQEDPQKSPQSKPCDYFRFNKSPAAKTHINESSRSSGPSSPRHSSFLPRQTRCDRWDNRHSKGIPPSHLHHWNSQCLIDGPKTGVPRQVLGFRQLTLTDLTIDIARGARTGTIARKWDDDKIQEGWRQTPQARKIRIRKRRNELNDFERFVALRLKKQVLLVHFSNYLFAKRHYEVKMMFEREDREKKKATGWPPSTHRMNCFSVVQRNTNGHIRIPRNLIDMFLSERQQRSGLLEAHRYNKEFGCLVLEMAKIERVY